MVHDVYWSKPEKRNSNSPKSIICEFDYDAMTEKCL